MQADVLRVEKRQYSRRANAAGAFSADIYCRALKYAIVAEAPLQHDARLDAGSVHSVVLNIPPRADGFRIIRHESLPDASLAFVSERPGYYLLLNRSRGEAVLGSYWRNCLGSLSPTPQAVRICRTNIRFVDMDREWMEGATLVWIEPTEIARFSKTIHIENFALKNQPEFRN